MANKNRRPPYKTPKKAIHTIAAVLVILVVFVSITMLPACEYTPPGPLPVGMISTTLNSDGKSGSNYFKAAWKWEAGNSEDFESLLAVVEKTRLVIGLLKDTTVRTWVEYDKSLLILEATTQFRDPAEIEGILAVIYGRGYSRPDISIDVQGPVYTELKTTWFIEMTVNPAQVHCIENFKWKVNMPAEIVNLRVTPSDADVYQAYLDNNTVEFGFEKQQGFVTVSVEAEESRGIRTFIWPIIIGVVVAIIISILAYFRRQIIEKWRITRHKDK